MKVQFVSHPELFKQRAEIVSKLLPFIPEHLRTRAFVAGSFAAVPEKAEDIDVWILDIPEEEFAKVAAEVASHIQKLYWDGEYTVNSEALLRHIPRERLYPGRDEVSHFFPVGTWFPEGLDLPIQVILSSKTDPEALLKSFDISTHLMAYPLVDAMESMKTQFVGEGFTIPTVQPRVTNIERPQATLSRIDRIASRYGFGAHRQDIDRLVDAINANRVKPSTDLQALLDEAA